MSEQLQKLLGEFGCNILNYTQNKIFTTHFYSEERYNDYLNGKDCRGGMGLYDTDEVLVYNKVNDNTLVIIQHDGVETAKYKYIPIFKATMEYKDKNTDDKTVNKTLTFKIRKSQFDKKFNFIDTEYNSLDFNNIQAIKDFLIKSYGTNKLIDWSVYNG